MPIFFLVIGLLLIMTVVRGTTGQFAKRLGQDISGGYLKWLAAIIVIGVLGFVPSLKLPSRYLMGLVAIVILLKEGSGFISQLAKQISDPGTASSTTQPGGNANLPAIPVQTQSAPSQGGGASSTGSSVAGAVNSALSIGKLFGL